MGAPDIIPVSEHKYAKNNSLRIDDMDQNVRLDDLMKGQREVLEMISHGSGLTDILTKLTEWAERQSEHHCVASILLIDETGTCLLHGAAPHLPDEYNKLVNGLPIGSAAGSCGTAAYTHATTIVTDIAASHLWADYKDIAAQFNLRACWSTPLLDKEGHALGTFALYYHEPLSPTAADLQLMQLVSQTAIVALEFNKAEIAKKKLSDVEDIYNQKVVADRQNFYHMLMSAPALIAVLKGPEHTFELANGLYEKAIGKTGIVGKTIKQVLPELEEQGIFDLLNNVYNTGIPYNGNEVHLLIDINNTGTLTDIYFNFTYQPIKADDGSIEGIFVHAVDVTETVMAKYRAEKSEQQFRKFVLNAPTPIGIYIGREMRIETANDAILQAWEKDSSVIGKTFREALPELEGQPFSQLLDDVFTSGNAYMAREAKIMLMRNGAMQPTYYNFVYSPLRDESGNIIGVLNTADEVTDLVVAKQKMLDAEEGMRLAIESAEMGVWSIDIKNMHVNYSDRILNWYGFGDKTEIDFTSGFMAVHDKDRERVMANFQKALDPANGGAYYDEYRVVNISDHSERLIRVVGNVHFDENNAPETLTGAAMDITMQRHNEVDMEMQVRQRTTELNKAHGDLKEAYNDLAKVNKNLEQYAYVASHDLQEPLRKINLYADMLHSSSYNKLDTHGQKYLDKIGASALRMSALITALLNFSKVETKEDLFIDVSLNDILRDIKTDYEMLIRQKNATINIASLCTVNAIPLQMNQLFYNLLGNALKFSDDTRNPVIDISSHMLSQEQVAAHKHLHSDWSYCEIIIKDNGIGFDQAFAEQIFVLFQRLHSRDKYEGTGIGLALCKRIVDNHNGEIFATSTPQAGTMFHVILPTHRH